MSIQADGAGITAFLRMKPLQPAPLLNSVVRQVRDSDEGRTVMAMPAATPMQELETVLGRYDHDIDEPETIPFIAKVREKGIISDSEWKDVLRWLDEAMIYLKNGMPKDKGGALMIDADPRNADWPRTVRAQRLAGYRMPLWASLWLWRIGHDREEGTYWKEIGAMAKAMRFPQFKEGRG